MVLFDNKIKNTLDKAPQQDFRVKLFDYQLSSIKRMKLYEKMNFEITVDECTDGGNFIKETELRLNMDRGILGERIGTGKSLIVLGLINYTKDEESEYNYNYMTSNYSHKVKPPSGQYIKTSIIIYEKNKIYDWKEEVGKTNLKYMFVESDDFSDYGLYDVIFIPVDKLKNYVYSTFEYVFKRVIIDNCRTNNYSNYVSLIKTHFTWYMADDYKSLIKRFKPLKDIRNTELLVVKCKKDLYNNDRFAAKNIDVLCKNTPKIFFTFREIENIKKAIVSNQIELVSNYIGAESCTKSEFINKLDSLPSKRLEEIKTKIRDISNEKCCICIDNISNPVFLTCCHTVYCLKCIVLVLLTNSAKCPICRSYRMNPNLLVDVPYKKLKNKITSLLDIIDLLEPRSKFIIVSNDFMINNSIVYSCIKRVKTLKGRKTEEIFRKFNDNELNGMIIEDFAKVKGNVFKNVTDIFFLQNINYNEKKNIIYSCLNAVNNKVNIYNLKVPIF